MKKFALLFSLLLTLASLSFAMPPAQENPISASQAENAPDSQSYPLLFLRCAPINYPKYALRYELQGDTTISAIADADGKVISAEIAHRAAGAYWMTLCCKPYRTARYWISLIWKKRL